MKTESTTKSPIADDLSKMIIAQSLPCSRCGYDIRKLHADGDCPECGEPISLTIIETVDPAARRLTPIQKPRVIGNAMTGIVSAYFVSILLSVVTMLVYAPTVLPVPRFLHDFPAEALLLGSTGSSLLAFLFLLPMMRIRQRKELVGCRTGIVLTGFGLLSWSFCMLLVNFFLHSNWVGIRTYAMLFDICLPVISAGLVFSGFRKLIPRLGLRSRAFRQAQGSRQRMNDLLAALVIVIVGRTVIQVSSIDSNLLIIGLIIMVMSISLILIGLVYVLRNTIWIRNALITPPPTVTELLHIQH